MRIVYASDLHSNKELYHELNELIYRENADELILGGDLFEHSRLKEDQLLFLHDFLIPYLKSIKIPVSLIAGNTDIAEVFEELKQNLQLEKFNFLNSQPLYIGSNIPSFGCPFITPSPFKMKNFERLDLKADYVKQSSSYILDHGKPVPVSDDYLHQLPSIEEELESFCLTNSIWVTHIPPSGGILDVLQNGQSVGSQALRNKIIQEQPLVTLHGHIHESPRITGKWYEEIGNTVSVNAGQDKNLHAVILDIESSKIRLTHTIFGEYVKLLKQ
ncbi:Icc-related predicted phosphoesterase [Sporosarcina luteola]|nr:Icc-related predicted phosphoesterase [Sporosarcina luteola]